MADEEEQVDLTQFMRSLSSSATAFQAQEAEESGSEIDGDDDMMDGIVWGDAQEQPDDEKQVTDVQVVTNVVAEKELEKKPTKTSQGKKRKRASKKRLHNEYVHRMDSLCQLSRCIVMNSACDEATAYEAGETKMPMPFAKIDCMKRLQLFVHWFADQAKIVERDDEIETNPYGRSKQVDAVVNSLKGTKAELTQAFVSLARSVGVPCRLVTALEPKCRLQVKEPPKKKTKKDEVTSSSSTMKHWVEVLTLEDERVKKDEEKEGKKVVVELDSGSDSEKENKDLEWVPVLPLSRLIGDLQHEFNETTPYIVALGPGNFLMDVTRRYAARWTKTSKFRMSDNDGWWQFLVNSMQQSGRDWLETNKHLSRKQRKHFQLSASVDATKAEKASLEQSALEEDMPTSIEGFRRHAKYILARQINKFQAIQEGVKNHVGLYKGEKVYLRQDVEELCSKTGWRKKCRVVRDEELGNPVKHVEPRRKRLIFNAPEAEKKGEENQEEEQEGGDDDVNEDEEDDEAPNTAGQIPLYGKWQTDEYVPPQIGPDGKIPKNQYGNYELWTPECCPRGAVHITEPYASVVAKELGVDYAPALVGFESRDFRMVPKIEGIIVPTGSCALVRDAALAYQQKKLEEQQEKRTLMIAKRWGKLTKAVLVAERLKQRYNRDEDGKNGHGAAAAEPSTEQYQSREGCRHEFERASKRDVKGEIIVACKHCGFEKQVEEI